MHRHNGFRQVTLFQLALATLTVAGCSDPICSPTRLRAVIVVPVEAASSDPLASVASGTAGFSAYSATLERGPTGNVGPDSLAGGGRSGTYAVHVEAPGYTPFDTTGVVVASTGGACGGFYRAVFTARLTAAP